MATLSHAKCINTVYCHERKRRIHFSSFIYFLFLLYRELVFSSDDRIIRLIFNLHVHSSANGILRHYSSLFLFVTSVLCHVLSANYLPRNLALRFLSYRSASGIFIFVSMTAPSEFTCVSFLCSIEEYN